MAELEFQLKLYNIQQEIKIKQQQIHILQSRLQSICTLNLQSEDQILLVIAQVQKIMKGVERLMGQLRNPFMELEMSGLYGTTRGLCLLLVGAVRLMADGCLNGVERGLLRYGAREVDRDKQVGQTHCTQEKFLGIKPLYQNLQQIGNESYRQMQTQKQIERIYQSLQAQKQSVMKTVASNVVAKLNQVRMNWLNMVSQSDKILQQAYYRRKQNTSQPKPEKIHKPQLVHKILKDQLSQSLKHYLTQSLQKCLKKLYTDFYTHQHQKLITQILKKKPQTQPQQSQTDIQGMNKIKQIQKERRNYERICKELQEANKRNLDLLEQYLTATRNNQLYVNRIQELERKVIHAGWVGRVGSDRERERKDNKFRKLEISRKSSINKDIQMLKSRRQSIMSIKPQQKQKPTTHKHQKSSLSNLSNPNPTQPPKQQTSTQNPHQSHYLSHYHDQYSQTPTNPSNHTNHTSHTSQNIVRKKSKMARIYSKSKLHTQYLQLQGLRDERGSGAGQVRQVARQEQVTERCGRVKGVAGRELCDDSDHVQQRIVEIIANTNSSSHSILYKPSNQSQPLQATEAKQTELVQNSYRDIIASYQIGQGQGQCNLDACFNVDLDSDQNKNKNEGDEDGQGGNMTVGEGAVTGMENREGMQGNSTVMRCDYMATMLKVLQIVDKIKQMQKHQSPKPQPQTEHQPSKKHQNQSQQPEIAHPTQQSQQELKPSQKQTKLQQMQKQKQKQKQKQRPIQFKTKQMIAQKLCANMEINLLFKNFFDSFMGSQARTEGKSADDKSLHMPNNPTETTNPNILSQKTNLPHPIPTPKTPNLSNFRPTSLNPTTTPTAPTPTPTTTSNTTSNPKPLKQPNNPKTTIITKSQINKVFNKLGRHKKQCVGKEQEGGYHGGQNKFVRCEGVNVNGSIYEQQSEMEGVSCQNLQPIKPQYGQGRENGGFGEVAFEKLELNGKQVMQGKNSQNTRVKNGERYSYANGIGMFFNSILGSTRNHSINHRNASININSANQHTHAKSPKLNIQKQLQKIQKSHKLINISRIKSSQRNSQQKSHNRSTFLSKFNRLSQSNRLNSTGEASYLQKITNDIVQIYKNITVQRLNSGSNNGGVPQSNVHIFQSNIKQYVKMVLPGIMGEGCGKVGVCGDIRRKCNRLQTC